MGVGLGPGMCSHPWADGRIAGTIAMHATRPKEADVPNGIFPVPEYRPVPARTGPSLTSRIRTLWRRNRRDTEFSGGADRRHPLPAGRLHR